MPHARTTLPKAPSKESRARARSQSPAKLRSRLRIFFRRGTHKERPKRCECRPQRNLVIHLISSSAKVTRRYPAQFPGNPILKTWVKFETGRPSSRPGVATKGMAIASLYTVDVSVNAQQHVRDYIVYRVCMLCYRSSDAQCVTNIQAVHVASNGRPCCKRLCCWSFLPR